MNETLNDVLRENETLWIPIAFDHDQQINGIQTSKTRFGTPTTDKRQAWTAARELCDSIDGVGFCVRRADPVKETIHE